MATETTPLQQRPVDEFNRLVAEEDKDQSLFSLLTQRPFTAALAFTLFCLAVLVFQTFSQIGDYDWSQVPQLSLNSASIEPSGDSVLLKIDGHLELDLTQQGLSNHFFRGAADWLGDLEVSFEQTQILYDNNHLLFADITGKHQVNLSDPTEIEASVRIYDVGHTSTLQKMVNAVFDHETINCTAKGAAVISKLGISYRVPFTREFSQSVGNGEVSDAGLIDSISIAQGNGGLLVDVVATFFSQGKARISAELPPTDWKVKIEDCKKTLQEVCQGHVGKLFLDLDQDNNVTVGAVVKHLPGSMIGLCGDTDKSPLDTMVSRYLSGEQNNLYIEGQSQDPDSLIGQALEGLNFRVPISGKPMNDKLVEWVQVHKVSLGVNGYFSGEAVVNVHLPKLFSVDPSAVFGAQNIRGEIILMHNGVDFGKIVLEDWNPCVTSMDQQNYLVEVYFNHVPFEVLDAREAAIASRDLMLSGSVPVGYKAKVDVDIITPVAHFFLSDFALSGSTILERS